MKGFRTSLLAMAVASTWTVYGCDPEKPSPIPSSPTEPYVSCDVARNSGAILPLHPGDPGWNPKLDKDGDGVACE